MPSATWSLGQSFWFPVALVYNRKIRTHVLMSSFSSDPNSCMWMNVRTRVTFAKWPNILTARWENDQQLTTLCHNLPGVIYLSGNFNWRWSQDNSRIKYRRFSIYYIRQRTAVEHPHNAEYWSHVLQEIDCYSPFSTLCFCCSCRRRWKTPVSRHFPALWYVPDLIIERSDLTISRRTMGHRHCWSVYHVPWPVGQGQCVKRSKLCQRRLSQRHKSCLAKHLDLAGR